MTTPSTREHWDNRYTSTKPTRLSWYEQQPALSIDLLQRCGLAPTDSVIDIGGGTSTLVDNLLVRGHTDLTVLDLSAEALKLSQQRNKERGDSVHWIVDDIRAWTPTRQWNIWHDRATFHFLVDAEDRHRYLNTVAEGLTINGLLILGTFAPNGPAECSGLPVERYEPERLFTELSTVLPLELLATKQHDHTTPDGTTQPFTWIIARRRAKPVCC